MVYKKENRISRNAVRIYGSAGNQVFHPLGDDNANLIISHELHNNFTVFV